MCSCPRHTAQSICSISGESMLPLTPAAVSNIKGTVVSANRKHSSSSSRAASWGTMLPSRVSVRAIIHPMTVSECVPCGMSRTSYHTENETAATTMAPSFTEISRASWSKEEIPSGRAKVGRAFGAGRSRTSSTRTTSTTEEGW